MEGLPNLDLSGFVLTPRVAVFIVIALILVYVFVQLVRMLLLTMGWPKRKPKGLFEGDLHWAKEDPDFQVTLTDTVPGRSGRDPRGLASTEPVINFNLSSSFSESLAERARTPTPATLSQAPRAEPAVSRAAMIEHERAQQRLLDGLERELQEMRSEVGHVRQEMQALKEAWQAEINQVKMGQSASPVYSDAMQLALRGADAGMISDRCGIPDGEARLVVAMVSKQRQRA